MCILTSERKFLQRGPSGGPSGRLGMRGVQRPARTFLHFIESLQTLIRPPPLGTFPQGGWISHFCNEGAGWGVSSATLTGKTLPNWSETGRFLTRSDTSRQLKASDPPQGATKSQIKSNLEQNACRPRQDPFFFFLSFLLRKFHPC